MLPVTDGYCLRCIRLNLNKGSVKNKEKPKKTRIAKVSKKRKEEAKSGGQYNLFIEIWSERETKSEISDRSLKHMHPGHTKFVSMFAHILPKGKYTKYRTRKENIIVVHPDEHTLIDHGTEEQRGRYSEEYPKTNWDIFFNKQKELKSKYPN